ncbi:Uncharacterised protein [Phocoenobacter uteri]|uniref:Uncharacterized protein n=1 Tax=Phocoenobacter uteri TaxID=146806 RepID=A0A379C9G9_9PAST|nr:hypothetical protein [Phocoenobacter uteri]MDG6882605.1 hypothetical protein [Phocoenobacter uteri]SUB58768.1 Uncharacterised protein [Phocoenobacter uteri]
MESVSVADYIISEDSFSPIDGHSHHDSLVIKNQAGKFSLDFTNLDLQQKVDNISEIDLTQDGNDVTISQVLTLDYDAVKSIAKEDTLIIKADAEDVIHIEGAQLLDQNVSGSNASYVAYDLNNDQSADLFIQGGTIII